MRAVIGCRPFTEGACERRNDDWRMISASHTHRPSQLARIAGVLYLIVIVGGFFAQGFVSAALVVPGDAAATVRNVDGNELLYRSGLVAHVVILLCNIPLAVIF